MSRYFGTISTKVRIKVPKSNYALPLPHFAHVCHTSGRYSLCNFGCVSCLLKQGFLVSVGTEQGGCQIELGAVRIGNGRAVVEAFNAEKAVLKGRLVQNVKVNKILPVN